MGIAGLAGLCKAFPHWTSAGLLSVDTVSGTVSLAASHGGGGPLFEGLPTRWPLGISPTRHVMQTGRPLPIPDIRLAEAYPLYRMDAEIQGHRSSVLIPLETGTPIGSVVSLQSTAVRHVSDETLRWLECFGQILHLALSAERTGLPSRSGGSAPRHEAVDPAIARLLARRNDKLIDTVRVFARLHGRRKATADALGIHISTLRYRLDLAGAIMEIDCYQPEQLFRLARL